MGAFLVYMIKSAFCLLAFYAGYKVLLSRDTFHGVNRALLLGCSGLSFLLPALHFTASETGVIQAPMQQLEHVLVQHDEVMSLMPLDAYEPAIGTQLILMAYVLGAVFMMMRKLVSLASMVCLIRRSRVVEKTAHYTLLIQPDSQTAPFSWMRYIVLSVQDYEELKDTILEHEKAHIRYGHSWDLILADCCVILQWFNPAAWLLRQELQNVHEYQADAQVLEHDVDARLYQLLLIRKVVGKEVFALANHFNNRSLTKRIEMIKAAKSGSWAVVKVLFVLPVSMLAVAVFARQEVKDMSRDMENAPLNNVLHELYEPREAVHTDEPLGYLQRDTTVYRHVAVKPEYPGGGDAMLAFLAQHVHYPKESLEAGEEGLVKIRYVVDEDGHVLRPHIVNMRSLTLARECQKAIAAMPQFTPAMKRGSAVRTVLEQTFYFNIQGSGYEPPVGSGDLSVTGYLHDGPTVVSYKKQNTESMSQVTIEGDVLFLLDGKAITKEEYWQLNPEQIKTLHILKKPDEIGLRYGEKYNLDGKTTVIEIEKK